MTVLANSSVRRLAPYALGIFVAAVAAPAQINAMTQQNSRFSDDGAPKPTKIAEAVYPARHTSEDQHWRSHGPGHSIGRQLQRK
jgi:hypothetical protein